MKKTSTHIFLIFQKICKKQTKSKGRILEELVSLEVSFNMDCLEEKM